MKARAKPYLLLISLTIMVSSLGCKRNIGEPNDQEELKRPENVMSFDRLYKQHCSACHGENGSGGPALDLSNPNYQALVDDSSLRRWITSGMPGTEMPAFGESAGGFLTADQINALIAGMRSRWVSRNVTSSGMPPYSSEAPGTLERGSEIFQANCSTCHQQGKEKITDPSYLALVSDQALRTVVIAGRPDLGQPNWRQVRPAQPLTDQDVNDVVAFLHSQRSDTPGQPYPERSVMR
jgi:cytochrome c oxidase cbb3-type subunit III